MNKILAETLENLQRNGIEVDKNAENRFEIYKRYLVSENEKYNLTAITEPDEVDVKHFADCALFASHLPIKNGIKLCDVGSGAGFPGMVLKIIAPYADVTLIDGLNKRINFLNGLAKELDLKITAIHARAEEAARKENLREQFDIVTARAVAAMPVLSELCMPLVKVNGIFAAMKGPNVETEMQNSRALQILAGAKPEIICDELENNGTRYTVISKKISQTPTKYPRQFAKISKQPL